jgi:hypothetical protein
MMVENHKLKNVKEHCKRLDERMQGLHNEFHESMTDQQSKWQEQWVEQTRELIRSVCRLKHYQISSNRFLLLRWQEEKLVYDNNQLNMYALPKLSIKSTFPMLIYTQASKN